MLEGRRPCCYNLSVKEDGLDQGSVGAEERQQVSSRSGACYNHQALLMGEEKQKMMVPITGSVE